MYRLNLLYSLNVILNAIIVRLNNEFELFIRCNWPISYTDDINILSNFIFTGLHGYEITPGLSTNKQRHHLLLLKRGYILHQPIFIVKPVHAYSVGTLCWSLKDWIWVFPKSWEREFETWNRNSEVSRQDLFQLSQKLQTSDQIFCFRFWIAHNQLGGSFKPGRPLPQERS